MPIRCNSLWAPLLDRRCRLLRLLGQRRGWLLASQIWSSRVGLFAMAMLGTGHGLTALGVAALVVAFASATQDIAWRPGASKSPSDADELGLLTSANTLGLSRRADLGTEALHAGIAQRIGWTMSYTLCGLAMAIGITGTLLAPEPASADQVMARKRKEAPLWSVRGIFDAIAGPFIAFFKAHGTMAVAMLLAITPLPAARFRPRADVQSVSVTISA